MKNDKQMKSEKKTQSRNSKHDSNGGKHSEGQEGFNNSPKRKDGEIHRTEIARG